jgi:hypothetical protein
VIVVANQFSSIQRTDDRGTVHFETEMIPLRPIPGLMSILARMGLAPAQELG